jgi:hypothetical protein
VNRVEVDLQIGAATTTLNYWLNQTGTSEPPATGTIAVAGGNGDWSGGVDTAVDGLGAPSPSFMRDGMLARLLALIPSIRAATLTSAVKKSKLT